MVSLADPRARERLGATVSSSVDFQPLNLRQIEICIPARSRGLGALALLGFLSPVDSRLSSHPRLLLWSVLPLTWQMDEVFV